MMNASMRQSILLLMACLMAAPAVVSAADKVDVEEVIAAWKRRQESARTFRFAWTASYFEAKNSGPVLPGEDPFPTADRSYRQDASCEMDGSMMRYSYKGQTLQHNATDDLEYREYLSVSDGDVSKIYFPLPTKITGFPLGMMTSGKLCSDANTVYVMPLLLIYRATDPQFLFPEQSFHLSPRAGVIDGRECAIVEYKRSDYVYAIWVDPDRDYLPLRIALSFPSYGQVSSQADITYIKDEALGWRPDGWRFARPVDQPLKYSLAAKVTSASLGDRIPISRFRIDFPPGTVVQDDLRRLYYLLGENGEELPVPKKR